MPQPIQHPVFGSLKYSEHTAHWTCELPVPACLSRAGGQDVFCLSIYAEHQEPPNDQAVNLWLELTNCPQEFSVFLERAIFAAYQRDLPHYKSMMGVDRFEQEMADLTRADQVWQHVGLHDNVIKPTADGGLQLVVALTAKWRQEYGMDLVFRQGQLGIGEGFMPWAEMMHFDLPN
jgi:hypothetical protein